MRLRVARLLLSAAALAAILAIWAWLTGGFKFHLFGVPISARGEHRAAFIALTLATIGFFLHTPLQQRIAAVRARVAIPPFSKLLFPAAAAAAAVVLWLGLAYGARAAGGADQYGYVSQADLWRRRDLRIRQPFVASVPWPNNEWTFSPLGYKPSEREPYTIVPTYAPGFPLLMALFASLFGNQAGFWVPPLCGAALVLLTYLLGARLSGPVVGAIAALALACSPTALFLALSVMSDVPAAVFWAATVLLATRRTVPFALASAIASGIAILIRPNLVFAAAVPGLMLAWPWPERAYRAAIRRAAVFLTACAPFVLVIAWLFNYLYGSPFRSGYGDNSALFALDTVPRNLANYSAWLLETQGPLAFLFLLAPVVAVARGDRSPRRWFYAAFLALSVASYLVYLPFDAWWYLRFLLPAFPFIFILSADAVWSATSGLAAATRNLAMALLAIVLLGTGVSNADTFKVLDIGHGEQKYVDVGHYLDRVLPSNAVVYSMQHCGSIRYYSGRLTLRWDYLPPDWLDRSIDYLRQAGYEPFWLLDDWEVDRVAERFASQKGAALFAAAPKDEPCTHATFLYRIVPRPGEPVSVRVPYARCE